MLAAHFDTGSLNVTVTDNEFSGTFRYGVNVNTLLVGSAINATITENSLTGDFNSGIFVDNRGGQVTSTISNNLLNGTFDNNGIRVSSLISSGSALTNVTGFQGNIISGISQTGILVTRSGAAVINVNGTLNPAVSNEVSNETGNALESTGFTLPGHGGGQFYLNGQLITMPATLP